MSRALVATPSLSVIATATTPLMRDRALIVGRFFGSGWNRAELSGN
jgi:hypothetical protein